MILTEYIDCDSEEGAIRVKEGGGVGLLRREETRE